MRWGTLKTITTIREGVPDIAAPSAAGSCPGVTSIASFTDQKPGVTAALPIIADDGEIRGVLGLDIDLEQLSTFLASLQIGRSGRAMIIDETGRLVASPDLTRLFKRVGEELQPVKLDDLGDPVLTPAFNHYRLEGHGHRALDVDQRRYISTASSLHATIGVTGGAVRSGRGFPHTAYGNRVWDSGRAPSESVVAGWRHAI